MDDLYAEIQQKTKDLDVAVRQLRKNGTAYAQKEHDYKVLLRTECLKLRDEGTPVGLIDKICHGIPSVARARLERDIALVTYEANKEAINTLKLQSRLIDAQLTREYGTGGTV